MNKIIKILFVLVLVVLVAIFIVNAIKLNREKKSQTSGQQESFEIKLSSEYGSILEYQGDIFYSNPDELEKLIDKVKFDTLLISNDDTKSCDWKNGVITLNTNKSQEITEKYNENPFNYEDRLFIANLNHKRVFAGTTLFKGSSRAIDFPVIYFQFNDNGPVEIVLRSSHQVSPHNYENDTYYSIIWTSQLKDFCESIN